VLTPSAILENKPMI